MAEMAVSLAVDQLLPLLREEANLLRGIHKEFADIKDELESIQAFLKDADKRAATTKGDNTSEGAKIWVKQVREAAFRIEDVIDDYMIQVGQQPPHPGCVALFHKLKSMIPRRRIASEIQDVKSYIRGMKERSGKYGFQRSLEQRSSSSREGQNSKWHDPRVAALYIEESEVVGFEAPRKRLTDWMVKGREERTVVSVVGMGGQGKTTLAKKVFDSKDVVRHFNCRVWITVSQSYNVEELLRDMLTKFFKEKGANPPQNISRMDRGSLTDEVRNYLQQKRYVVVFDDVWSVHFWDDIEFAVIDNKNGSKILITTRNLDVVVSCKKSSFSEVLKLEPLTQEQSLELFNKKAFKFDSDGRCPKELIGIANEIVQKCKGLPLAIVAIGGLLSTKEKTGFEWHRFRENLSLELSKDTHLIGIKEILGLSYDDLPYYLKSCLLYFVIYPEDYLVRSKRVIQQWIAEGFVKEERGKTLEEVAEGYLTELIHRSLVQVSSHRIDGKVKSCGVHDLIREMILEKNEVLNFCKHINDDGQSTLDGITRRLLVTTGLTTTNFYDLIPNTERSHVRSLFIFGNNASTFLLFGSIPKFRLLKVLDYECVRLLHVPNDVGSLIHLKYLSFNYIRDGKIPKSIGMLQNLETLEVRDTDTLQLPKEISKLRKLRHLIGTNISLIELKNGIGEMASLQTLRNVDLDMDGAAEVIKQFGKLKQIRDLGLINVHGEDGSIISSSINEMQHLEKLFVASYKNIHELDDLHLNSTSTMLRKLTLSGSLQKLPEWIPELQNLVVLRLMYSFLTNDPMQSLKSLQHLLILSIKEFAYEGSCLHFEDGGFQKLRELYVETSNKLRDIIIDQGALPSLKKLRLYGLFSMKNIPTGIQNLEKLEDLYIQYTGVEHLEDISTEDWNWIFKHVPTVDIATPSGFTTLNLRR
ncbi:disease resistance protein RPM1-like [Vicia villosa]|uniref:disease resistance protein RPM1-like n=1 Tax=Vicia villosa TaxID=3911 RepID=UPI00273C9AB4|nr:disease resistance protein RPM1-like [Vicia villosa]